MDHVLEGSRAVIRTTPEYWTNLTRTVPADQLRRAPTAGEWSAVQCLQHIIDFEGQGIPARIQAFLDGKDFPAYTPGRLAEKAREWTPEEMAAEFARLRKANLERLTRVSPADMLRKAIHPTLGEVTFDQMMHQWAAHDLNHTIQAQRAMMQPFIEGCGPWQVFFADHVIKESKKQ